MLTEALALKRIKLLDVVLEGAASGPGDDSFDADVALATGELRQLIPDLLDALGGPLSKAGDAPSSVLAPATAAEALDSVPV